MHLYVLKGKIPPRANNLQVAFEYVSTAVTTYNAPLIIKEKRLWLAFNFYGGCGLNLECMGFSNNGIRVQGFNNLFSLCFD